MARTTVNLGITPHIAVSVQAAISLGASKHISEQPTQGARQLASGPDQIWLGIRYGIDIFGESNFNLLIRRLKRSNTRPNQGPYTHTAPVVSTIELEWVVRALLQLISPISLGLSTYIDLLLSIISLDAGTRFQGLEPRRIQIIRRLIIKFDLADRALL
ncbi:hypothetical protein C1Y31_31520 [Pseudomonas sp. FW305-25]|nr:hypothetical protein C1Y31_31520 [Pseudomonas sp. FW305-25]PMY60302.1 hypothetical protein C1Y32_31495 [Pseudomonas sp. FW126-L8]PNA69208.1 hypothetical protein C1Y33_31400 [Pseudomonas sp. FW305-76]